VKIFFCFFFQKVNYLGFQRDFFFVSKKQANRGGNRKRDSEEVCSRALLFGAAV
jgi:hypothetical protein